MREEREKQRINEEIRRRRIKEEEKNKKKELEKAIGNYTKNQKLSQINEQNINKIFGEKSKNLTNYEKIHLFDRKINPNEVKEKMNLKVTLRNPNKDYKYKI